MLDFIVIYLAEFSYFAIFVFFFISHLGPIPEEAILIASGYVASLGVGNIWYFVLFCFLGVTIGDSLAFLIARKKGEQILGLLKNRFRVSQDKIERTVNFFSRHPRKSVFLSRFLIGFRFFAPYAAGVVKIKPRIFIFFNMLGALVWVPFIVLLTYLLSSSFDLYQELQEIKHYVWITAILVVGFIVGWKELGKDESLTRK